MRGDVSSRQHRMPLGGSAAVMLPLLMLLAASFVLLVVAVVHGNDAPAKASEARPWYVLGVPVAVALFSLAVTAVVGRDQYARSQRPGLRYDTQWFDTAEGLREFEGAVWDVVLANAGPGVAEITGTRWELRLAPSKADPNPPPVSLGSFHDLRDELARHGLRSGVDYWMANVTPGAFVAVQERISIFEGSADFVGRMADLAVVFEYESAVGDRYRRRIRLVPDPKAPKEPDDVHRRDLAR